MISHSNMLNPKTHRPYNFAPGPATLPEAVLKQAQAEMLDWHGCGVSVMEMSHRGPEFGLIYEQAITDLRELLSVPDHFKILFMQGGGLGENAIVPMNLSHAQAADFVLTGSWSQKSAAEAARYCDAGIAANAQRADGDFRAIPALSSWQIRKQARYVHICSNETIHGIEFQELPDLKALTGTSIPLVVDASSHILSRPVDWSRVGLMFAGAQKNIGPAGLTLVFVREDLIGHALKICPSAFNYETVAQADSMYNTPPTFAIYIAGLVFQWLKAQGGVAQMQQRAIERSEMVYKLIDSSNGFYIGRVDPSVRSRMNVTFFLKDERLNASFINDAKAQGLLNIRGHKSVGGMRASLYNAMDIEGAKTLVNYMKSFAEQHG